MSFLDRFKIQPKHKSPDPDVRARLRAGAAGGPLEEDGAVLVALAREDSRRAGAPRRRGRVDDVAVLAAVALCGSRRGASRGDSGSPDGRSRPATARTRAPGSRRAHRPEADCRRSPRRRRSTAFAPTRSGALTDVKSLSSVARHAADARIAALATERVQDHAELLNIAAKTDHKDAGVGALERAVAGGDRSRHSRRARGRAPRTSRSPSGHARWSRQSTMRKRHGARLLEQHQQRVASSILTRIEALAAAPPTRPPRTSSA